MYKKRVYNIKIAIDRLKKYCALQDRCKTDVIKKMKDWGLLEISRNHILEILIQEEYINETRYAKSFSRGKFKINKWGKIKIREELRRKGISEISINNGLEEITLNEYTIEINKQYLKKKKYLKENNIFIKKKKIADYLINKGYESNLVWDKLRELKE